MGINYHRKRFCRTGPNKTWISFENFARDTRNLVFTRIRLNPDVLGQVCKLSKAHKVFFFFDMYFKKEDQSKAPVYLLTEDLK